MVASAPPEGYVNYSRVGQILGHAWTIDSYHPYDPAQPTQVATNENDGTLHSTQQR